MRLYAFLMVFIRAVVRVIWRPLYIGAENIPHSGPVVMCANHTHWADPVLMACASRRPLHFMSKEELFHIPVIGWVIRTCGMFPIKRGTVDRASIRMALSYLGQGEILGIFPEGTRSKTGEMLAFLNGAAYFAVKSGAVIVPVAINGHYRLFQRMVVKIGVPIHVNDYGQGKTGSEQLDELSKAMMKQIAQLRDGD